MRHALVGLALLIALPGCSAPSADDDFGPLPDFSLTERSGRTVTRDDLLGKVWVASFVFTRCLGPCPQVSGSMARLQSECAGTKDFELVTFTVDPEHDTPRVLQDYAGRFGADPESWLFLTGDAKDVYRVIIDGFHLGVEPTRGTARTPGSEVIHSTKLALVDRRGHVRGYFDGRQVDEEGKPAGDLPKLKQKINDLLREKS